MLSVPFGGITTEGVSEVGRVKLLSLFVCHSEEPNSSLPTLNPRSEHRLDCNAPAYLCETVVCVFFLAGTLLLGVLTSSLGCLYFFIYLTSHPPPPLAPPPLDRGEVKAFSRALFFSVSITFSLVIDTTILLHVSDLVSSQST